jgi:hypothetical protein
MTAMAKEVGLGLGLIECFAHHERNEIVNQSSRLHISDARMQGYTRMRFESELW